MHIFIIAMPLKILVGLLVLSLTMPYLTSFLGGLFTELGNDILILLKTIQL
jgi:flagellar biosynthesis protein FliR